jgi:hypothetical protein
MLAMVASRDPENDAPGPDDLYGVGVAGTVARMMKVPDGTLRILVQGVGRIRIGDYVSEEPYLVAQIEAMPDVLEPSTELEALTRNVQSTFTQIIEAIPYLPEELQLAVANLDEPAALSHLISGACASRPRRSRSCSRPSTSRAGCAASPRSSPGSSRSCSSAPRFSHRSSPRSTRGSANISFASSSRRSRRSSGRGRAAGRDQ